jgi:putative nucleotidyltransferase with HDIG domain
MPLLAATLTIFLINTALVASAIGLSERQPVWALWRRSYGDLIGTYAAFALLGLLIGVLRILLGWSSVLFVLMPLLVARHAFQAAVTMQGAYDETVKGLVAAIEAKDPYPRGHAQRVSRLSEMTARAYGLSEERCRAIRYSALMHDVGKLGVWNKVLKKPGKLTPEEYEHMKDHPILGVEIVSEIDLLQEAIDGVRHHHERMDGHGYPDGLQGEDIPLFARLIMVCDAFDSMTSTRVYRVAKTIEEAFAELRRCAGTQFDEACLVALEKAVAQHGWEPVGREELEEEPPIEGPAPMEKEPSDGSQAASI